MISMLSCIIEHTVITWIRYGIPRIFLIIISALSWSNISELVRFLKNCCRPNNRFRHFGLVISDLGRVDHAIIEVVKPMRPTLRKVIVEWLKPYPMASDIKPSSEVIKLIIGSSSGINIFFKHWAIITIKLRHWLLTKRSLKIFTYMKLN